MLGSTLFDAIFTRDSAPITKRAHAAYRVGSAAATLSESEAYDLAERFAVKVDADATCERVTNHQAADDSGGAHRWEFAFRFPVRAGVGVYQIVAEQDAIGSVHVYETLVPACETSSRCESLRAAA